MRGLRAAFLGVVLVCVGAPAGAAPKSKAHMPLPGKVYAWDFQADTLGLKPAHTAAFGGTWQVIEDSTSSTRLLSQSETDDGVAYHYLNFTRPTLEDLDASVRFRIRSGEIDPSAGLLFQVDPKGTSGYLVRASARSGEVAFHYLLYGKRRDVKFAKIPGLAPGTWHTLGVSRRRSVLKVLYDGQEVMTVRDDRFSRGTVGVWTEDDTRVDFADLTATVR